MTQIDKSCGTLPSELCEAEYRQLEEEKPVVSAIRDWRGLLIGAVFMAVVILI